MDWALRTVLAWRLSNTMDAEFCVDAVRDALARVGKPEISKTDQGSRFASADFTGVLRAAEVTISMDGRGRWMDNSVLSLSKGSSSNGSGGRSNTSASIRTP